MVQHCLLSSTCHLQSVCRKTLPYSHIFTLYGIDLAKEIIIANGTQRFVDKSILREGDSFIEDLILRSVNSENQRH